MVDAPYKEEDLDASKLGVDTSFPVLRSPWLKVAFDFVKAPVYSTSITPNSPWLVPLMFGRRTSREALPSGRFTWTMEELRPQEHFRKLPSLPYTRLVVKTALHIKDSLLTPRGYQQLTGPAQ